MTGILINELELGYSPISAYHFQNLIRSKTFLESLSCSHLYIIVQRKELTFDNLVYSHNEIGFQIKQNDNPNIIHCILPLYQNNIANDQNKEICIRLQNRKNTIEKVEKHSYGNIQGIQIQEIDEKEERHNLIWFSPEKFLQNYWKGLINAHVIGNIEEMLKYNVLYVGKSTEQNICERLSNHSTFQSILSNQVPLTYGNIPSDEIAILLFEIKDNTTIIKWSEDFEENQIADYISNYMFPSDKIVSLDAEKALINHLQPHYNRTKYKNFPNTGDLVHNDIHNHILYSLVDPITLTYEKGFIKGGSSLNERNYIKVKRKHIV